MTFPQTPEEIKKEKKENKKHVNSQLRINQRDFQTINNLKDKDRKTYETVLMIKKNISQFLVKLLQLTI